MPRALGVEQDYEQLRTVAQDRIAAKQEELHAVMLRKAAAEEVDLDALKSESMGARWPAANPNRTFPCVLSCSYNIVRGAGVAVQAAEMESAERRARCCELLVDAGAAQTLADAQDLLPLWRTRGTPKPERVRRLLAALRLCRWDVTGINRQWFQVSPVRVVQRSEFLKAAGIRCVAACAPPRQHFAKARLSIDSSGTAGHRTLPVRAVHRSHSLHLLHHWL